MRVLFTEIPTYVIYLCFVLPVSSHYLPREQRNEHFQSRNRGIRNAKTATMAFIRDRSIITTMMYLLSVERFAFTTAQQLDCVDKDCEHTCDQGNCAEPTELIGGVGWFSHLQVLTQINCKDTQTLSAPYTEHCVRRLIRDITADPGGVVEINCGPVCYPYSTFTLLLVIECLFCKSIGTVFRI